MTIIYRQPRILCRIDGREVIDIISARCRHGFDQAISEASIIVPARPSWVLEWSVVELWLGENPGSLKHRFKGFVTNFDRTFFGQQCIIQCKGPLIKAQMAEGSTVDGMDLSDAGDGDTDQEMVIALLDFAGLTGYYGTNGIEGTGEVLGTVSDQFILKEGQSALGFIQELDSICLGYRTFDGPGGNVVRRKVSARPTGAPTYTFTEGVDIEQASSLETITEVRNRIVVEGFIEAGTQFPFSATRQQASPYIPVTGGYRTFHFSSTLLEKDEDGDAGSGMSCGQVAEYLVEEMNQVRTTIELVTPRADVIFPQMTIKVVSNRLELNRNFWVQSVEVGIDASGAFSQSLEVVGGVGSTAPIVSPPIADFSYLVDRESLVVGGVETIYYTVSCLDQSIATQGSIVSWAWTATGATPSSSTVQNPVFQYTDLAGKAITLTVTDSQGTTDTLTLDLFGNDDPQQKRRKITLAGTLRMERFDGNVWRTDLESGSTSVLVAGNGPVAGAGSTLMSTDNDLITSAFETSPFGVSESITSIWMESDVSLSRILVGSQFGRLGLSLTSGATWTIVPAGPWGSTPILRVVLNRFNSNSWRVLTAGGLYRTDNGGTDWITDLTASGGETFIDLSVSHTRWMVTMSGGRLAVDSNGATQTFPGSPTSIKAVTAHIREDRFYFYDSDGNTYYTTTPGGTSSTQGIDLPQTGSNIKDRGMWRDGDIIDLVYFVAGTDGAYKSVDGFRSSGGYYRIRQPGIGNSPVSANYVQIGLDGGLSLPQIGVQNILIGTALGLVQRLGPNLYQQIGASDITDDVRMVASPFGFPLLVYVIADSGAKKSTDGGVTWATLNQPAGGGGTLIAVDGSSTILYMTRTDSTNKGVWKSTDGGTNWSQIKADVGVTGFGGDREIWKEGARVWVLLADQGGGAAATIYHTDDDFGATTEFADIPGSPNFPYASFPRGLSAAAGMFALQGGAAFNRPVYHITSGGATARPVSAPGTNSYVQALVKNTLGTIIAIWVGDLGYHLIRSINDGVSWHIVVPAGEGVNPDTVGLVAGKYSIAYNPSNPSFWVHAGDWPYLFISQDDGLTWVRESMTTAFPSGNPQVWTATVLG